jgi:CDGSH-type Zn-finger protein
VWGCAVAGFQFGYNDYSFTRISTRQVQSYKVHVGYNQRERCTRHATPPNDIFLALLETRKVGGIKLMAQVKITVRPNGPFRVEAPEGSIELVDVNGTQYDLTGKPAFSLCRCGGSVNKPFCDGTHSRIGFQGAELAVKKADG